MLKYISDNLRFLPLFCEAQLLNKKEDGREKIINKASRNEIINANCVCSSYRRCDGGRLGIS